MATSRKSKRKSARRPAKVGKYSDAIKALQGARVPKQEFGRLNKDGTVEIDPKKLERLKKNLKWGQVKFVALNAPFKRRTPIPPA